MLRSVLLKTLRDQRRAFVGWGLGLVGVVLMYSAFFPSIQENAEVLNQYMENLPEAMRGLFGEADIASPQGYLQAELFSAFGPLLLLIYAIGTGARAIAGEEERGTLDLLLSTPIPRRRVVWHKFAAMTGGAALLAVVLWAAIVLLGPPFDLSLPVGNVAAACLMLFLVAVGFGSLALALGCLTGRRGLAIALTSAVAVVAYIVSALAPSVSWLEPYRELSPFYYTIGAEPLANGLDPAHALLLAAVSVVLLAVSLWAFERRDLAA